REARCSATRCSEFTSASPSGAACGSATRASARCCRCATDQNPAHTHRKEEPMSRMIFVNLPVKDLERSKAFYEAIGFRNEPKFTNDAAAMMVLSDTISVMLLTHPFYATFTRKPIADATTRR